jgi:non-homologous end joining protein Ku
LVTSFSPDNASLRLLSSLKAKPGDGKIELATKQRRRPGHVIDLMDALKRSLDRVPARARTAALRKKRRA